MFIMYCIFNLFSEFFRSYPQGSVVNLWKILADQLSIKELNASVLISTVTTLVT